MAFGDVNSANRVRTKLIATLGPATDDPPTLAGILEAGVDVCRLNFSHGDLGDQEQRLRAVRAWAAAHGEPVAVLGDLCGPKIRLNEVPTPFTLDRGAAVRFVRGYDGGTPDQLTTNYHRFVDEVTTGQRILIDDGMVHLLVVDRDDDTLYCVCTTAGVISSRKGVNLPETVLSVPALTEKDRADLRWALEQELDFVSLSFVRHSDDLRVLRDIIDKRGQPIGVVAKIEKPEALEQLDEIVALADGIMVARGDLGVEMDLWRVPLMQKRIVQRCRAAGKPVIIATQMLQSMTSNRMPTRAEVSDVANAVFDAADAVMLSGESAVGQFPVDAVEMIGRISQSTEHYLAEQSHTILEPDGLQTDPATRAITRAAVEAALQVKAKLIVAWTARGETVRLLARHRVPMPVVALTHDEHVWRRLTLFYGVLPLIVPEYRNPVEMTYTLDKVLQDRSLARRGDIIVVVSSTDPETPGRTNTTLLHRVGERWRPPQE